MPLVRFAAGLVLAGIIVVPAAAADPVGFRLLAIPPLHGERPLEAALWYPAGPGGAPIRVPDNPVFEGQPVLADAVIAPGPHRLILLSHGYGGNWTNQSWLAAPLAQRGYVVAAVNHPGTTTKDMTAAVAARLWERPQDLSRTIDAVTADPAWPGAIMGDRVAAIGHSLGGWTVMALAGGRFDPGRFAADCQSHPGLAACQVFHDIGAGRDPAARAALGQSRRDTRIVAAVSLDLGLARGFDPASLAAIAAPVLVVAAGTPDARLPAALESRSLADHLPAATTRYVEIAEAAHFSFLPVCKPGGAPLIGADQPDDAVICQDGPGGDRAAIHQRTIDAVLRFLAATLPPTT